MILEKYKLYRMCRSLTGFRLVKEGDSTTHYMMSSDDLSALEVEIAKLERRAWDAESDRNKQIEKMKEETKYEIHMLKEKHRKEVEMLEDAREEIKRLNRLNFGLKKIIREKKNVEAGNIPAKKHTGYVVLGTRRTSQRFESSEFSVWETRIQTPYSTKLELSLVEEEIKQDLMGGNDGEWLLGKIGIETRCDDGYNLKQVINSSKFKGMNTIYKIEYRADDLLDGFWTVVLFHTLPITPVPEEMNRAKNKNKKN